MERSDEHCSKKQKVKDQSVRNCLSSCVESGCCESRSGSSSPGVENQEVSNCASKCVQAGYGDESSSNASVEKEHVDKTSFSKNPENSSDSEDSNYFRSYADLSIHKVMIEDHVRTQAYRKAILSNYKLFYKKVVADVGAGTGILSVFCAQAGAQKVYAIEGSSVAEAAKKVVAINGLSDQITVIHGKVEDITLPEKVDIIVSEWMGYMLMYESMLPSVLHARDNWLKAGGHIFPEEVKIHLAPISDFEDYNEWVEFCKDVKNNYKIDMSPLVQIAEHQMQAAVRVVSVSPTTVQAHASCVASIHLPTVDASTVGCIKGSFKSSCFGYTDVNGFVVWFTAHFPDNITLSTSPYDELTHWEQSVIYVKPVKVHQDSIISGQLCLRHNKLYHRFLNVELEYQVNDGEKIMKKYELRD